MRASSNGKTLLVSKDGGDLVTTLLLGFPQGVVTALFIVALLAWGYLPGPEMIKKNPEVIYSVVWLQGISGILGTLIGFCSVEPSREIGPGTLLDHGADHIYFRVDGRFQRNPRCCGFVVGGGIRHIRLFHEALRVSQTCDDTGFSFGRVDGKISLSLDDELWVYLALASRGDRAFDPLRYFFLFRGARPNEARDQERRRWQLILFCFTHSDAVPAG